MLMFVRKMLSLESWENSFCLERNDVQNLFERWRSASWVCDGCALNGEPLCMFVLEQRKGEQ